MDVITAHPREATTAGFRLDVGGRFVPAQRVLSLGVPRALTAQVQTELAAETCAAAK